MNPKHLFSSSSMEETEFDFDVTSFAAKDGKTTQQVSNFRAFAENSLYAVTVIIGDGRIVYANGRIARMLGYSRHELYAAGRDHLFAEDVLEKINDILTDKDARDHSPMRMTSSMVMKDGRHKPAFFSVSVTLWDSMPAVVVLARDAVGSELGSDFNQSLFEEALKKQLRERDLELDRQRRDYESINLELLETNKAIAVLARNYEKSKEEVGRKVAKVINAKILPILLSLKDTKQSDENRLNMEVLESHLRELSSGLLNSNERFDLFSASEMRVASMIKNGATSQEIANQLFISPHTVKTHRKNIRKKLNIQNEKVNLSAYLNAKM